MTKKDYELIAKSISETLKGYREHYSYTFENESGIEFAMKDLVIALAQDNSRFDRDKFLKACGVE